MKCEQTHRSLGDMYSLSFWCCNCWFCHKLLFSSPVWREPWKLQWILRRWVSLPQETPWTMVGAYRGKLHCTAVAALILTPKDQHQTIQGRRVLHKNILWVTLCCSAEFSVSLRTDIDLSSEPHTTLVLIRGWTTMETSAAAMTPPCWCSQHDSIFHTISEITKTFSKQPRTTVMAMFSSIWSRGQRPSSSSIYLIATWKTWLN